MRFSGAVWRLWLARVARAQDERRVTSPDGQLEFRLFVSQPGSDLLPQLAYQVRYRGRIAVDTSFLGFNIHNQVPMLGEKDGLTSSRSGEESGSYRWLIAEYMQNGSLGRRINVEVRVWDHALAFRYVIPRSAPLDEILIEDELTEFDVAGRGEFSGGRLPAAIGTPAGWIGIAEVPEAGFPMMSLARTPGGVPAAQLERGGANPAVAFEGRTPLVCPWRVVSFGGTREEVLNSTVARVLRAE